MEKQAAETRLSIPEAVLLGHALVARVADSLGIRAFFIKGPASVIQGLRQPKISGDVDVFVAPSDLEAMLQGLRDRGWRERPVDEDSALLQPHSVTVDHPEWPCCIDVHFRFPGMEAPPEDSFDVMWANMEEIKLAGHDVKVPSMALGILILALHALRSPQLSPCSHELEFLTDLAERDSHETAVLKVASATGSLAAVRPFLEALLPKNVEMQWPEASMDWRTRMWAKEPGSGRLTAIARSQWQDKPNLLFRSVFPRPEFFLSANIYADMSFRGRLRQHRARWARFLRSVPKIVRDLNQRPR